MLQYTFKLPDYDPAKAMFKGGEDADSSVHETPLTKYLIGFEQSLDALLRYDVYVNAQGICPQAFVGNESFIRVPGLNDTITAKNIPPTRTHRRWTTTSLAPTSTLGDSLKVKSSLSPSHQDQPAPVRHTVGDPLPSELLLTMGAEALLQ